MRRFTIEDSAYDDPIKHFSSAISAEPRNPMLHAARAHAYREPARNDDFQPERNRAKALDPKEPGHWEFIARSNRD